MQVGIIRQSAFSGAKNEPYRVLLLVRLSGTPFPTVSDPSDFINGFTVGSLGHPASTFLELVAVVQTLGTIANGTVLSSGKYGAQQSVL